MPAAIANGCRLVGAVSGPETDLTPGDRAARWQRTQKNTAAPER